MKERKKERKKERRNERKKERRKERVKERRKKETKKLTNQPTPWSTVLLGKITCSQLVKKSLPFYGNRMFITAFKSSRRLSLPGARSNHSTPFIIFNEDPFQYNSNIYASVIHVYFFLYISPPKFCMHLLFPPYVLHAPPS